MHPLTYIECFQSVSTLCIFLYYAYGTLVLNMFLLYRAMYYCDFIRSRYTMRFIISYTEGWYACQILYIIYNICIWIDEWHEVLRNNPTIYCAIGKKQSTTEQKQMQNVGMLLEYIYQYWITCLTHLVQVIAFVIHRPGEDKTISFILLSAPSWS